MHAARAPACPRLRFLGIARASMHLSDTHFLTGSPSRYRTSPPAVATKRRGRPWVGDGSDSTGGGGGGYTGGGGGMGGASVERELEAAASSSSAFAAAAPATAR